MRRSPPQLPLFLPFNGRPPFVRDVATREAAADSVASDAGTIRAAVLAYVKARGGATCDEVEVALGLRHQTAGPRLRELALTGAIVDGGSRRRTRSGRAAIVWAPVNESGTRTSGGT